MPKQNPKPRSLRAQAFEETNYPPDAVGLRCVEVKIPDSVEFMAQLAGLVALATKQFNYQNKDTTRAAAVAQLWRDAYLATDWEGCMNCEDVADCIENNEDTQNALRNWLDNNYQFSPSDFPPNIPLPTAQRTADRAGIFNPTCDHDILWAQSIQLVEWMNDRVSDALEIIEAATNSIEVAGALTQITGFDEVSVDAIFAYGALLQDFIAENYAAAYTTNYRDELACDIFCAAYDDCEISLDDLFNLFKGRVEAYFGASGTFSVLDDVIDYLLGQSIDDTIVADCAFFLLVGGAVLANWVVGGLGNDLEIGTKVLNLLLKLAVNDANNDWLFLCSECVFEECIDPSSPQAAIISGEWSSDAKYDQFAHATDNAVGAKFEFVLPSPVELVNFTVNTQSLGSGGTANQGYIKFYLGVTLQATPFQFSRPADGGYVWKLNNASAGGVATFDDTTNAGIEFDRVEIFHQHNGKPADVYAKVCFSGIV